MNLWRLDDPWDGAFASAILVGTWSDPQEGGRERRIPPAVIEWEPGSDVIGDFTWGGASSGIVTKRVAEAFCERFRGFELGPVEMIQDPKLKRPQRVTRRTKRRVWLPYEGPRLFELWVTAVVAADLERSTLEHLRPDPESGAVRYGMVGDERIEFRGGYGKPVYKERVPREPGKGVYIAESDLRRIDIFRVEQLPGRTFCVDAVRKFVLERKFTNVDFFGVGETF